jgi:hypothetical protein
VADSFHDKHKPAGAKSVPQHEIDAQLMREKTARLRALRLAQEGANPGRAAPAAKRGTVKKAAGKTSGKPRPLSEWLDTQEKEGRRN